MMAMDPKNLDLLSLRDALSTLEHAPARVLLIRSAPEKLVSECAAALGELFPGAEITLLCHEGRKMAGLRSLTYPDEGFFSLGGLGAGRLAGAGFDLVVTPYATDRRLSPAYFNVDEIAVAAARGNPLVIVYRDMQALVADREFMERKRRGIVEPYLARRAAAIDEIRGFTGESAEAVTRRCDMAGIEATRLWQELDPSTPEQVRAFYAEHDFYIYELMKTEYNGDRDELLRAVLEQVGPGEEVVDYGGGCGIFSIPLAEKGARVTHLDVGGPLLDFVRYRFARRGLEATVLEAADEEPLGGTYDKIVSIYVVEHLARPEAVLSHMAARLQPGGSLLIAVDYEEGRPSDEPLPLHLKHLDPTGFRRFMRGLGLELTATSGDLETWRMPG